MDFAARMEEIIVTPEQEAQMLAAAEARAAEDLHKVDAAEGDEMLFYAMPRGARAAFRLGQFDRAGELAGRVLTIAPLFSGNWNFGNAIHAAHTVLGLLA